MAKYKCIMCGYIFDEILDGKMFSFLDKCPSCEGEVKNFKLIKYESFPKKIKYYNAIEINEDNLAINKDYEKCIDCGLCKITCEHTTGINDIDKGNNCIGCGKCVQACPVKSLMPKSHVDSVRKNIGNKICIAYIAPSVRVTVGDLFKMSKGENVEGKLITALRKIGFDYIFDTCCGADLTVIEEANELAKKIKYKEQLPMLSSCCPSWIKYVSNFYPEYLKYVSTTKSPIEIEQTMIDSYFLPTLGKNRKDVFSVAIVPCTSKKIENSFNDNYQADAIITVQELSDLLLENNIDLKNLDNGTFDKLLSNSSLEGTRFGISGGVTNAVIKTLYLILTGKECNSNFIKTKVSNYNSNIYEVNVDIEGFSFKAAYVSGIRNVKDIIKQIAKNKCDYHFVEIMTCDGGCINGSGNPLIGALSEEKLKEERTKGLIEVSNLRDIYGSHNNPDVIKIYKDLIDKPGNFIANDLLHIKHSEDIDD